MSVEPVSLFFGKKMSIFYYHYAGINYTKYAVQYNLEKS